MLWLVSEVQQVAHVNKLIRMCQAPHIRAFVHPFLDDESLMGRLFGKHVAAGRGRPGEHNL